MTQVITRESIREMIRHLTILEFDKLGDFTLGELSEGSPEWVEGQQLDRLNYDGWMKHLYDLTLAQWPIDLMRNICKSPYNDVTEAFIRRQVKYELHRWYGLEDELDLPEY